MGQMIHKPDANPVVLAVCNFFVAGGLGYFLIGQKKKAYIAWGAYIGSWILYSCAGWICLYLIPFPFIFSAVFAYDAYVLGQKLQNGQSVGENENGLDFLNSIFKD